MTKIKTSITSLTGGVSTKHSSKRLQTEVEVSDNFLLSLERGAERRPPFSHIDIQNSTLTEQNPDGVQKFLNVPNTNVKPVWSDGTNSYINTDNILSIFLDIDGQNRYCIILNRGAYEGKVYEDYSALGEFNLSHYLTVYRIEPTEWIEEEVETDTLSSNFDRGMLEYLTYGSRSISDSPSVDKLYYLSGEPHELIGSYTISETFGHTPYGYGVLLWNKLVPLGFLPDTANSDIADLGNLINSGSYIDYKIATPPSGSTCTSGNEAVWTNVRDNVVYDVNDITLELEEEGQNRANFSLLPLTKDPLLNNDGILLSEGVCNQTNDCNGIRAKYMIKDLYDTPRVLDTGSTSLNSSNGYLTSPLSPTDRPAEVCGQTGQSLEAGSGKVFFTREAHLAFPSGFYRATRHDKHPYFDRIRSEDTNSVFDHRRFPLRIFKGANGRWRMAYLPLLPRLSGNNVSSPGPQAVNRGERIQSAVVWKGRLWFATDSTVMGSQANNFNNFWVDDIINLVDSDTIDVSASEGSYNKLEHAVAYRDFLLITSSGGVQFEVRGGGVENTITPFNVEVRPTAFFSSSSVSYPQRVGTNLFFFDSRRIYLYVGGDKFNYEASMAIDLSEHCRNYLPKSFGSIGASTSKYSIFMVDNEKRNDIYIHTFRTSGETVNQNAFYRWSIDPADSIQGLGVFEQDLYIIVKRKDSLGTTKLYPYFLSLLPSERSSIYLDRLTKIQASSIRFIPRENMTQIDLPYYDQAIDTVVLGPEWNFTSSVAPKYQGFTKLAVIANHVNSTTGNTVLYVFGNYATQRRGVVDVRLPLWVGRSFDSTITLSTQHVRESTNGQAAEGSLMLRKLTVKHSNTGQYSIKITRNDRHETSVEYEPVSFGDSTDKLGYFRLDTEGECTAKVLSSADRAKITLFSNSPTPLNPTSIEFTGIFKHSRDSSTQI